MAIDIKKLQEEADGRLNRRARRMKERVTGVKIVGTNVPIKSTKVVTSKKSKHGSYNKEKLNK